jgi:hypothetical protein
MKFFLDIEKYKPNPDRNKKTSTPPYPMDLIKSIAEKSVGTGK